MLCATTIRGRPPALWKARSTRHRTVSYAESRLSHSPVSYLARPLGDHLESKFRLESGQITSHLRQRASRRSTRLQHRRILGDLIVPRNKAAFVGSGRVSRRYAVGERDWRRLEDVLIKRESKRRCGIKSSAPFSRWPWRKPVNHSMRISSSDLPSCALPCTKRTRGSCGAIELPPGVAWPSARRGQKPHKPPTKGMQLALPSSPANEGQHRSQELPPFLRLAKDSDIPGRTDRGDNL